MIVCLYRYRWSVWKLLCSSKSEVKKNEFIEPEGQQYRTNEHRKNVPEARSHMVSISHGVCVHVPHISNYETADYPQPGMLLLIS